VALTAGDVEGVQRGACCGVRRIPAGQRASEPSLRARLTAALQRNQQLTEENARLRRQLARALGDQRSTQTRSGNNPAP
jgi:hypothetical protein